MQSYYIFCKKGWRTADKVLAKSMAEACMGAGWAMPCGAVEVGVGLRKTTFVIFFLAQTLGCCKKIT